MKDQHPDTQGLGKVMIISAWVLALALLTLFFDQWSKRNLEPKIMTTNGVEHTVLTRNFQNQYITKGQINGMEVTFLLDTGATDVVVPGNLAKKLKLPQGPQAYANTAGGKIIIYQTRIRELTIGHITLHNVGASINPKMEDEEILLGMTALKKIGFHQQGDQLILHVKDLTKE